MAMNGSEVSKVAARLTMDISPAQQALKQLSADYQNFNAQLLSNSNGDAEIQAMQQTGQRKRALSYTQQENLRQIQQDGELKRLLMSNMYNQQMVQQQQDYNLRMTQIEAENQAARDSLLQQSGLRTMAVMAESQAKIESEQKLSDQRMEQEQQAHLQKMIQNEQMYEERMSQLQARGQSSSGGSGMLNGLGSRFVHDSTRYAVGTAAGMTTFAVLDQLAQIPQMVSQVSGAMAKLQQVLEISPPYEKSPQKLTDDLQQLQQVAGMMAVAYGVDFATVLDTMSQAGRKFKDVADIVVATDSALQLTAVDAVPASDSIKAMEAIMSQFGLSTTQAQTALYQITAAAHEFQTTGTDLASAIERSGSAFSTMKMNTSESIAAIATLAQMTAQSGSTIGNAWKSIENSLGSDKSVKALKDLGIEVYDANGNLKDSVGILQSLQAEWPKLSDQAKQHFATVVAGGKFQYARLEAFLNDYSDQYQRALTAIQQANRQQQEQLVKSSMESLPKQFDATKASFQTMANMLATQVTPALIAALVSFRNMDDSIQKNIQSIDRYVKMGMTLVEAYALWKVGALAYNGAMNLLNVAMTNFNTRLEITDAMSAGTVSAFQNMGQAALGMAGSVATAVGKMALMVAIAATLNNVMNRINNPDQAHIDDLQNQLNNLQAMNGQGGTPIGNFGNDLAHLNIIGAGQDLLAPINQSIYDMQHGIWTKGGEKAGLDQQISSVKQQLADAKAKKIADDNAAMNADFDKYKSVFQQYVDQANQTGMPGGGGGDSGTLNITPNAKVKVPSAASIAHPYADFSKMLTENLAPYNNMNKEISSTLSQLTNQQQIYADEVKYGATNTNLAADATQTYQQRLESLQNHQDSLHATNEQIRADMAAIADKIQSLNPNGADVTTLSQGAQQAISQLTSQYDQLGSQLDQNSKQWWTDAREMVTAGTDWLNLLYQLQQNGLKPLSDALHNNSNDLTLVKDQLNLANNALTKHADNLNTITNYTTAYSKEVDLLNTRNSDLSQINDKLKADNTELNKTMADLTDQHQQGKLSDDAYAAAIQSLNDQIQKNNDVINQNTDEIYKNGDAIQQATDAIQTKIIDSLKQGYQQEKQLQDDALTDQYNAQKAALEQQRKAAKDASDERIKILTDQKTAIDAVIQSLQAQWQAQQQVDKLGDLQNQLAQVMSQRNQEIIDTNGNRTFTYDQQKVTDLQKQIADQQATIAHDAQIKQLEQQKSALDAQIQQLKDAQSEEDQMYQQQLTDLQNNYNQQKQALDDYWTNRLKQDKLQSEADNLIKQEGYKQALIDAQNFVNQMNAIMAQRNSASISAGQDVSQGLGQTNATPSAPSGGGGSSQSQGSPTHDLSYFVDSNGKAGIGPVEGMLASYHDQYNNAKDQATKDAIHNLAYTQMTQLGGTYNDSTGEWTYEGVIVNGDRTGQVASAATGAYIPPGKEGLTYLHQNELVLNSPMVNRLDNLLNDLPRMVMPQFSAPQQASSQSVTINHLELPNVTDSQSFISELTDFARQAAYHVKVG